MALRRVRCFEDSAAAEVPPSRRAIALMSRDGASGLGFDMPAAGLEAVLEVLRCMRVDGRSAQLDALQVAGLRWAMIEPCSKS